MTEFTIGKKNTKTYKIQKGDYVALIDKQYLFIAGDRRTLNREAYIQYHSLNLSENEVLQFDLDTLLREETTREIDGKEKVTMIKWFL